MYKRSPPMIEARSDMPKNFSIPNQPNVPASSEHHFSREWLIEIPSGIDSNFCHVVTLRPINLKVIPHKLAKETIEKEMIPISPDLQMTEHTRDPIFNMPMPSLNHVLSIQHVHDHHPGKNLDSHCARA